MRLDFLVRFWRYINWYSLTYLVVWQILANTLIQCGRSVVVIVVVVIVIVAVVVVLIISVVVVVVLVVIVFVVVFLVMVVFVWCKFLQLI